MPNSVARKPCRQKDGATQRDLKGSFSSGKGRSIATGRCKCDGTEGKSDATAPSRGGRSDATETRGDAGNDSPVHEHDPELMRVLCFMTGSVQRILENAGMDASVASLIHQPWEIHQLAQAYDSAAIDDPEATPDPSKDVQRWVRDMIVIKVFLGGSSWTYQALRSAMDEAFQRRMEQTLESQIMHAVATMRRLGANRDEFDRWLSGRYGTALQQGVADDLFAVYKRCADASPDFQSQSAKKAKASGKTRPRKRAKDETTALDMETKAATSAARKPCQSLVWLGGVPDDEVS